MENIGYGRERLKNIAGEEAREKEEEKLAEDEAHLTPQEHERALERAYKSFIISGLPKAEIISYLDQSKPHIKALTEDQPKEMQFTKVIITLWIRLKKAVSLSITLDPKDVEYAPDVGGNTDDKYIKVETSFNSLMTEFFEGSDIEELMQHIFAHIKAQVGNPRMPKSNFTLDQIMHLHINLQS